MTANTLSRRAALGTVAAIAATPVLGAAAQPAPDGMRPTRPIRPRDNMAVPEVGSSGSRASDLPLEPLENADRNLFDESAVADFPRRYWAPELYAQTILAEFAATGWSSIDVPLPDLSRAAVEEEIQTLVNMMGIPRNRRLAEIIAQLDDPLPYWRDLMMITPATAPMTWTVMLTAVAVGQMVAMHYKLKFHRARPAQLYPALMPPAQTPRHPSYPNAHALQGHLIAACLDGVVPSVMQAPLVALAARVAENREIAGFHFHSDTVASEKLAPEVFAKLQPGPLFKQLAADARAEWP